MSFVGRSDLRKLIDGLVKVPKRGQVGDAMPVLVVEGCGGSGRSALLEQARSSWRDTTPVALVHPGKIPRDENSAIRPLLAAVMLELNSAAPGYRLSFERVLLAYIAITAEINEFGPDAALKELRRRTNEYRNRKLLESLVGELVNAAGSMAASISPPGADTIAPAVAKPIAEAIVDMLKVARFRSWLDWSREALDWFGHQGQGLELDPERARLQLGRQARSENPEIRRGVDDVLVAALLADLRYSAAATTNRPANVLVLLDDGDAPSALSFTSALLRVRQAIANTPSARDLALPDALTVVTTSGGELTTQLSEQFPVPENAKEAPWRRAHIGDLRPNEVIQLAKNHLWPDDLAASRVGNTVHRLTHGHPEATEFILQKLRVEPDLVDDIRVLLDRRGPSGIPIGRHLLTPFVRGLRADRHVDDSMVESLITLSAARDRLDAQLLTSLLPHPIDVDSPVLTSRTLWWHRDGEDRCLHPMVQYLGMRELASRAASDPASWNAVFQRLLAGIGPDDVASRLYYSRMLGERVDVSRTLISLLSQIDTAEWLVLFDQVVATVDPRETDFDVIRARGVAVEVEDHTFMLLGVIPAIEHDPCMTADKALRTLRAHAQFSYRRLADRARDQAPVILRAEHYA